MNTVSVTVVQVTTTANDLGDSTTATLEQDVDGALFEPQQATERTDSRSPGVVTPAKFYLPIPLDLDADDVILHGGYEWHVIGGSSVWDDQTEVPVKRASAV